MLLDAGERLGSIQEVGTLQVVDLVLSNKSGMQLLSAFRSHLAFHFKLGKRMEEIMKTLDQDMSKERFEEADWILFHHWNGGFWESILS